MVYATSIQRFGEFKSKCTDERKQDSKFFENSKTLKQRPNFGLQTACWHKLTADINSI